MIRRIGKWWARRQEEKFMRALFRVTYLRPTPFTDFFVEVGRKRKEVIEMPKKGCGTKRK